MHGRANGCYGRCGRNPGCRHHFQHDILRSCNVEIWRMFVSWRSTNRRMLLHRFIHAWGSALSDSAVCIHLTLKDCAWYYDAWWGSMRQKIFTTWKWRGGWRRFQPYRIYNTVTKNKTRKTIKYWQFSPLKAEKGGALWQFQWYVINTRLLLRK